MRGQHVPSLECNHARKLRTWNIKACPHWRLVADFGDNLSPVAEKCNSRRFLRQSHFSATVAVFADSVDMQSELVPR